MATLPQCETTNLELMIDAATLGATLGSLAAICREKADHIRSTWRDKSTARPWDAMASAIEHLADRADGYPI